MFRKPKSKSKPKLSSRSRKKDNSPISSGGDTNTLRRWLKPKQAISKDEPISTNPLIEGGYRVGESGVRTWESALKGEEGNGMLSTSSPQFIVSSDQVVVNNERSLDK